jgi:alpha-tubulin suppressor-like RCC1 family protein
MSSELLLLGTQQDTVTYGWGLPSDGRLNNNLNAGNFVIPPTLVTNKSFSSIAGNTANVFGLSGTDLWCWGIANSNTYFGQPGLVTTASSPIQITGSWSKFSRGNSHVLAIKTDGTLWSWGLNLYGQLGNGDRLEQLPIQIGSNTWLEVAAGYNFSIALRSDNTVWTFGSDDNFQLGLGLSTPSDGRSSPVQIAGGGTYTKIFAGFDTGYAIRSDGTLYGWGNNRFPFDSIAETYLLATGVPTTTTRQSAPVQISSSTGWEKVSCDGKSVLAIKNNELFAWSRNTYGQLGTGNFTTYSSPVQVGAEINWTDIVVGDVSFGIQNTDLYGWGGPTNGFPPIVGANIYPPPLSPYVINSGLPWQKVNAITQEVSLNYGELTGFACSSEVGLPNLYGWGTIAQSTSLSWPSYPVLIGQTPFTYSSPVQISSQFNLFSKITSSTVSSFLVANPATTINGITNSKQVYAWGGNTFGQLGDNTTIPKSSPVLISSDLHENVLSGTGFTIFLKTNGTMWAAGDNSTGYLGINSIVSRSSPTQIGSNTNWIDISTNSFATHAINSNNDLYVWGDNAASGVFGNGTSFAKYSSPVLVGTGYVSGHAVGTTFFAIKTDGSLWSTGSNRFGGLNGLLARGLTTNSDLTLGQILGTYTYPWVNVAPARDHVFALNSNGDLYGWGYNAFGQLGTSIPVGGSSFASSPVLITSGVSAIAVGEYISYFIRDFNLYGLGWNRYGRLGLNSGPQFFSSPTQIGASKRWVDISPVVDGFTTLGIATP